MFIPIPCKTVRELCNNEDIALKFTGITFYPGASGIYSLNFRETFLLILKALYGLFFWSYPET